MNKPTASPLISASIAWIALTIYWVLNYKMSGEFSSTPRVMLGNYNIDFKEAYFLRIIIDPLGVALMIWVMLTKFNKCPKRCIGTMVLAGTYSMMGVFGFAILYSLGIPLIHLLEIFGLTGILTGVIGAFKRNKKKFFCFITFASIPPGLILLPPYGIGLSTICLLTTFCSLLIGGLISFVIIAFCRVFYNSSLVFRQT